MERFWAKMDASAGPDGCWPWTRCRTRAGYGQACRGKEVLYAHRVAWELVHGSSAGDMHVLHSCDNPPCCNPAHLRLGTPVDNAKDASQRGRAACGERSPQAKLTARDVAAIRELRTSNGFSWSLLARAFGVSPSQARRVAVGERWTHV